MKIKTTLILILMASLISIAVFFQFSKNNKESKNTPDFTQDEDSDVWSVPEFENDFSWKIDEYSTTESNHRYPIYWSNYKLGKESEFGEIITTGKIYTVTFADTDTEFDQLKNYLDEYWDKLGNSGWEYRKTYPDLEISGIAADGVFGSTYGYIKIYNGKIRQIAYSISTDVQDWAGPGSEVKCPCSRTISIFMGDPVKITDQLPEFSY